MLLFLFLNIDLYFLGPVDIAQINFITELVIFIGTPRKKAKVENEIDPVTVEAKVRKCSI